MTEWPPFVIEGPAEDPGPASGWEEVVFEVEDSETEVPVIRDGS
ncbi:MAG TPA: hypothetical protein VGE86_10180 [Thermoanaerobaculia bacterium]